MMNAWLFLIVITNHLHSSMIQRCWEFSDYKSRYSKTIEIVERENEHRDKISMSLLIFDDIFQNDDDEKNDQTSQMGSYLNEL